MPEDKNSEAADVTPDGDAGAGGAEIPQTDPAPVRAPDPADEAPPEPEEHTGAADAEAPPGQDRGTAPNEDQSASTVEAKAKARDKQERTSEPRKAVYNVFLGQVDQRASTLGFEEAVANRKENGAVSGKITEEVVQEAIDGYSPPGEAYAEAYGSLQEDHVVVLTGAPGLGKRTSTLVMLHRLLAKHRVIYSLPPSISLKELGAANYEAGHGYVVLDRLGEGGVRSALAQEVRGAGDHALTDLDHTWLSIAEQVREAKAYLVVTMVETPPRTPDSVRFVAWERPEIATALRTMLGGEASAATIQAIAERVPVELPMTDLARIAATITAGRSPEQAVADVLDEAGRREVHQWFEDRPIQLRVLEVTVLAFVVGVVERDFETCLRMLNKALAEAWPTASKARQPSSIATSRLTMPRTTQIGSIIGVIPGTSAKPAAAMGDNSPYPMPQERSKRVHYDGLIRLVRVRDGASARRVLAFREDGYRRYVLGELADRYPNEFWDGVRAWLNKLIKYEQLQISISAGLALLSYTSCEEIEYSYLEPWSKGECGWHGQTTAVYVLWFMCLDEALVPVALRTAEAWAGQGTALQRLTAVHAFAGELGVRFPNLAARRLWQLVRQCNALSEPAALAFGELFATLIARDGDAQHVVTHLNAQLRDIHPVGRTRTRYQLTLIAVLAVLRTRNGRTGNPAVVEYLYAHPEGLARVADLWAKALQHRPYRNAALEALLSALNAIGRLSGPDAEREARTLGDALGGALPPEEHALLKTDFINLMEHTRSRPARSKDLSEILLAALDRAVRAL